MAIEAPALLVETVALLAAAVIAVPLFKRIGLGPVLAYLAAGVAVGPWAARLFTDPDSILHFAEFGVVLLLFVIGLELRPARLWAMRHDIFVTGSAQVLITGAVFTPLLVALGFSLPASLTAGLALALSSTAFGLRLIEDKHELDTRYGRKAFAILLLQDVAIVPLLALAAVLAPYGNDEILDPKNLAVMAAALAGLVFVGRWVLNPLFRIIATTGARELLTAVALLVVVGAALAMQVVGLSMAMGAFVAGVLLADSSYRHQLEADIEPFRGLLLALFFMAIGMSIDIGVIVERWPLVAAAVVAVLVVKGAVIFLVLRASGTAAADAALAAGTLAQVGEFAFVMVTALRGFGLIGYDNGAVLTSVVALTMAATPLTRMIGERLAARLQPAAPEDAEEDFDGAGGAILIIGFGRFGQLAAQPLLAHGCAITIVDNNPNRIQAAREYGFKVYYGDMTRLSVLRSAGAEKVDLIAICPDGRATVDRITALAQKHFPTAKLYVRAIDRDHALELRRLRVDYLIREVAESAFAYSEAILIGMGTDPKEAADVVAAARRRDADRLALQEAEGLKGGMELIATQAASAVAPGPAEEREMKQAKRKTGRGAAKR
ncbi:MAG: monovalent cation:proton antiporter-2 (CPA2) family protein [Flavobacteriaceae bacterium]